SLAMGVVGSTWRCGRRRTIGCRGATVFPIARTAALALLIGVEYLLCRSRCFNWSPRVPRPGPQFPFRDSSAAPPDGAAAACCGRYFWERFLPLPDVPSQALLD